MHTCILPPTPRLLQQSMEKSIDKCSDVEDVSYGWGIKNDFSLSGERKQTGTVIVALIGLPSTDVHERFPETNVVKGHVALLTEWRVWSNWITFDISYRSLGRMRDS